MIDMTAYIAARSDQLNADDLLDAPRTITITKVTASPDSAEQPVSIHYDGDNGRPFKPCKTVRRIMVGVWGKDASQYVGRSMTLYRDPSVSFGGMQVGGIRVSHMSHISDEKTISLMVTRGRKAPYKVKPLKDAPTTAAPAPTEDSGRAKAEKWVDELIVRLGEVDDAQALMASVGKTIAKLQREHPDLYDKVMEHASRSEAADADDEMEPIK